jgi:dihydrofolate synthase/folylpolyglutamate synthase
MRPLKPCREIRRLLPMRSMTSTVLSQWLTRLESIHPREIELGLDRSASVANNLNLLPLPCEVITVAGTNGKGSTVAVLEALLIETKVSCGACTSPHFERFNERIRIDGFEVGDEEIVAAFEDIEAARGDISLTYFEFSTLAALLIFRQRKVEVALLEVGLGGRLDAVNIVDANAAIITSIDLDHQDWLGDTRELIALEKAGVLRRDKPAVIADTNPPKTLVQYMEELGCQSLFIGKDYQVKTERENWTALLQNRDGTSCAIKELAYSGIVEANIAAATQTLLLLGKEFSEQQLHQALRNVRLRGRRETASIAGYNYLLDVAHNPASVTKLLEYINATPCNGKDIALFSAMEDKDIEGMMSACKGTFDAWFIADQPRNSRAEEGASIAKALRQQGQSMISISKNITQAFRRAQGVMTNDDRLVVFGSFYTVAGVMPLLEKERNKR